MSNDRTLPVTPAERACATVLRAWLEWYALPDNEARSMSWTVMLDMWDFFDDKDLVDDVGGPSPTGAALLARVEADRIAEDIARELVIKLQTGGAPGYVVCDAQVLLTSCIRLAALARLAATTPIAAPPAKEPAPLLSIRACKHPRATGDCYSCPDCGVINNCNLENGEPERTCQMCPGKCPNRAQYAAKEPR